MFFSLTLLVQFGLLWLLFSWLAGQDESTSKVNALMVVALYSGIKFALRILFIYQMPEIHWILAYGIQFGILYLLV